MTFPRKPDNSLDFVAFSWLPLEKQKEAFADLKANGTIQERDAFQAHRREITEKKAKLAQAKSELAELQSRQEALILKKAELQNNLKEDLAPHIDKLLTTLVLSATPINKPVSAPQGKQAVSQSFKM